MALEEADLLGVLAPTGPTVLLTGAEVPREVEVASVGVVEEGEVRTAVMAEDPLNTIKVPLKAT